MRGNCYVASEAAYHLLGGREAGWTPHRVRVGRTRRPDGKPETHWYLKHTSGVILDLTRLQFGRHHLMGREVPYHKGVGCGFLTRRPSKRARALMRQIVWQER